MNGASGRCSETSAKVIPGFTFQAEKAPFRVEESGLEKDLETKALTTTASKKRTRFVRLLTAGMITEVSRSTNSWGVAASRFGARLSRWFDPRLRKTLLSKAQLSKK